MPLTTWEKRPTSPVYNLPSGFSRLNNPSVPLATPWSQFHSKLTGVPQEELQQQDTGERHEKK